jgi:hypothetical protein
MYKLNFHVTYLKLAKNKNPIQIDGNIIENVEILPT